MEMFAYRSVQWRPGRDITAAQPVVRLAEGNAGAEVCHQAGVDRVEAVKEARVPFGGALGVGDVRGILKQVAYSGDPFVEIVAVGRLRLLAGLGHWGGFLVGLGRHCGRMNEVPGIVVVG